MGAGASADTRPAEMAALREAGWSVARLMARYGLSKSAVAHHLRRLLAVPPKPAPLGGRRHGVHTTRDGRTIRPFSAAEDRLVLALRSEGMSLARVGAALGRSAGSVRSRLATLGVHEERGSAVARELGLAPDQAL